MNQKMTSPDTGRIAIWDIEAAHLKADIGIMLCAGVKFTNEDFIHLYSIADYPEHKEDPTNDRRLVVALRDKLAEAEATVAHYGQRFDLRFLNSRLLYHGEEPLPPMRLIDTWQIARSKLALTRNSLINIQHFLKVENSKTPLEYDRILKCVAGDMESLELMVDHCEADVLVLEEIYNKLRPLMSDHPFVGPIKLHETNEQCPACGSTHTQRRGQRRTRQFLIQRVHCNNCGSWFNGTRIKVK